LPQGKCSGDDVIDSMLLFICHASEDQADFVKKLADKLKKEFEVWYAPYALHVGDSLREKIDDGLKKCDYGIVVLSPAFFAKNWPQNELDALFALEKRNRKMILPIWKDVTKEDVQGFSPLLAGRHAAKASEGVQQVVAAITLAIEAAHQQKELDALETITNKVAKLQQTVAARDRESAFLFSERGVQLIVEALHKLYDVIRTALLSGSSKSLTFAMPEPAKQGRDFFARTVGGLRLDIRICQMAAVNNATDAYLEVTIIKQHSDNWGTFTKDYTPVDSQRFKPGFDDERVVWRGEDKLLLTTDDLAEHVVGRFVDTVTEHIQDEQQGLPD
jgi:hypothetical protein